MFWALLMGFYNALGFFRRKWPEQLNTKILNLGQKFNNFGIFATPYCLEQDHAITFNDPAELQVKVERCLGVNRCLFDKFKLLHRYLV